MIKSITKRFYTWINSKIESYRHDYKYLIVCRYTDNIKLTLKVFFRLFEMANVIKSYSHSLNHALLGLSIYRDEIKQYHWTIEGLIEELIEAKLGDEYTEEQEREVYREVYLSDNLKGLEKDGIPIFELPSKYMTRREELDWFDNHYEHQRDAMCGCYDTIEEQLGYEFDHGPLIKGGWYDKKKY